MQGATRTVKFALGENPKRCCFEGRYPDTRMGTQEIIRDHFLAARDYERRVAASGKRPARGSCHRDATCGWKRSSTSSVRSC